MTGDIAIRDARSEAVAAWRSESAELVAMLVAASQPYLSALYGESSAGAAIFAALMKCESSEFLAGHAQVLCEETDPRGCYVALPGSQLPACRRAELCEALRYFGAGAAASLGKRLALLSSLFPPVRDSDFYLSKLAVHVEARGRGFGRLLLDHYMERGRQIGFRRFRLDVSCGNHGAKHLYEAAGFRVIDQRHSAQFDLSYLAMMAER